MKAYLQIDLDIIDLAAFMEYIERIPTLIKKYSGRYLVQGVKPILIQGEVTDPQRSVLLEFPSKEKAEAFLNERAETDLHEIWEQSTHSRILLLDGCIE